MSMLRQDPLTGRWVIIAAGRSERPNEFPIEQPRNQSPVTCPFCPGNEDQTPPEMLATGRPDGADADSTGWRTRSFHNLYPALTADRTKPEFGVTADQPPSLYGHAPGIGHHEVVAYTPDHLASPSALAPDHLAELLWVLRARQREIVPDPGVAYVSVFCNHGPEAGATLAHPHMHVIGAPKVPLLAAQKAKCCTDYHRGHGRCLLCDLEQNERSSGARLVQNNRQWTAFAPWASRVPWEILFVPRRHRASLCQATDEELDELASIMTPVLRGLFNIHGDLSLNIVIHSATVDNAGVEQGPDSFHWHLEVLPRLSRQAGFEMGTGYTINSVVPEVAAERLRREWEAS